MIAPHARSPASDCATVEPTTLPMTEDGHPGETRPHARRHPHQQHLRGGCPRLEDRRVAGQGRLPRDRHRALGSRPGHHRAARPPHRHPRAPAAAAGLAAGAQPAGDRRGPAGCARRDATPAARDDGSLRTGHALPLHVAGLGDASSPSRSSRPTCGRPRSSSRCRSRSRCASASGASSSTTPTTSTARPGAWPACRVRGSSSCGATSAAWPGPRTRSSP